MVVCRPVGSVTFQTRHAVAGVVIAWVWSFLWNTPPLFGWGSYELEGVQTSCAPDWYSRNLANVSYIMCYFLLCFALPFSVIVISYTRLLWTLRQVGHSGKLQRTREDFMLISNQIKSITFIVTSSQHMCLDEWNSWERAPYSAETINI